MKQRTKQSSRTDKKSPVPPLAEARPLIPAPAIYALFAAWAYFALSRFFAASPSASFGFFFAPPEVFELSRFLPRLWEHLVNIFFALVVFAAAYGLGSLILDIPVLKAREALDGGSEGGNGAEAAFFALAAGLGALALVMFLLGLLGLYYKGIFLALAATGTVAGIVRRPRGIVLPKLSAFTFLEKLCLALFSLIAFFNLLGALTPEIFFDSQFYQLGIPAQWLVRHRIEPTTLVPASYMPFNVNMLYAFARGLNSEISAKLVHFLAGIILSGAVYVFAKKYFDRSVGVLAALIFYSVPNVMVVSWKTAVELGIGIFEFGMIFALVNYHASGRRSWLVLAGALCGFSLGSKYTSVAFTFLPAVITLAVMALQRKERIAGILTALLIFGVTALAVSAPWYARNLAAAGNPVFPFLSEKIGFETIRASELQMTDPPRPQVTFTNYVLSLWPMALGTLQQETYPGPVFLLFVPFVFFFRRIDLRIRLLAIYALAAYVLWAFLGRFYLRYFVPTLPVVSIIVAWYLSRQGTAHSFRKILVGALLFLAFRNLTYSNGILKNTQDPLRYVLGNLSANRFLSTQRPSYPNPYYPAVAYANESLPSSSRILFMGETRSLYSRREAIVHGAADRSLLMEIVEQSTDGDGIYRKFRENGITHLLLNVPEARRLNVYDNFYWDGAGLRRFDQFWKKYVREIYRGIGDIAVPQQGILSLEAQQPQFWQAYSSNPRNYVYLYEILGEEAAAKPHEAPYDFLLEQEMYSPGRWAKITGQ